MNLSISWTTVGIAFYGLLIVVLFVATIAVVVGAFGALFYWCMRGVGWARLTSLKSKQLIADQEVSTTRSEVSSYTENRRFKTLRKSDKEADIQVALNPPNRETA